MRHLKNFLRGYGLICCAAAASLLLFHGGCGLRQVRLHPQDLATGPVGVAPIWSEPAPMVLRGATSSFPYDPLMWGLAQFPCIRSPHGDLVMLDTGLHDPARLTPDVARDQRYPAQLGEERCLAFVKQLQLGELTATNVMPVIETRQWQFHMLGLPLFKVQGWWWWGMPLLNQVRYLAFDNPGRKATFGMEDFQPGAGRRWEQYDMAHDRAGMAFVRLPVNGVELDLLADSGGGPRLILSRKHWQAIAPRTRVISRSKSRYPPWYGFEEIDVYRVKGLEIGPSRRGVTDIWVRQSDAKVRSSLLGLGPLSDSVIVFDFAHRKFWISRS